MTSDAPVFLSVLDERDDVIVNPGAKHVQRTSNDDLSVGKSPAGRAVAVARTTTAVNSDRCIDHLIKLVFLTVQKKRATQAQRTGAALVKRVAGTTAALVAQRGACLAVPSIGGGVEGT